MQCDDTTQDIASCSTSAPTGSTTACSEYFSSRTEAICGEPNTEFEYQDRTLSEGEIAGYLIAFTVAVGILWCLVCIFREEDDSEIASAAETSEKHNEAAVAEQRQVEAKAQQPPQVR